VFDESSQLEIRKEVTMAVGMIADEDDIALSAATRSLQMFHTDKACLADKDAIQNICDSCMALNLLLGWRRRKLLAGNRALRAFPPEAGFGNDGWHGENRPIQHDEQCQESQHQQDV
jgi:hypothetical protein